MSRNVRSPRADRLSLPPILVVLTLVGASLALAIAVVAPSSAPSVLRPDSLAQSAVTCPGATNATGIVSNVTVGPAPLAVAFCVATAGSNVTTVEWWFGDGSNASGPTVDHTFVSSGAYAVHVEAWGPNFNGSFWEWIYARGTPVSVPVTLTATTDNQGGTPGADVSVSALSCEGYCWINWSASNATGQTGTMPSGNGGGNVYSFFAPLSPGNWTISVTVADPLGDTGNASTFVDVLQDSFQVYHIGANPGYGPAPLPVTFFVNFTGASGNVSAAWTFGDGGNGTGLQITHTYTSPGTYVAVAILVDSLGQVASGNVTISVTGGIGNTSALSLSLQPVQWSGPAPFLADLNGAISGGTAPYHVNITWGDGQFIDFPTITAPLSFGISHEYTAPGNFSVTATASDSVGDAATVTFGLDVTGASPLSATYQFVETTGPDPVAVAALVNVTGGAPPYAIQYVWGDGTVSSAQNDGLAVHLYGTPGTYAPYANVTDSGTSVLRIDLGIVNVTAANATSPAGHGIGFLPGGSGGWSVVAIAAIVGITVGIATTVGVAYERQRRVDRREGEGIARALESEAATGPAPGPAAAPAQVKQG